MLLGVSIETMVSCVLVQSSALKLFQKMYEKVKISIFNARGLNLVEIILMEKFGHLAVSVQKRVLPPKGSFMR